MVAQVCEYRQVNLAIVFSLRYFCGQIHLKIRFFLINRKYKSLLEEENNRKEIQEGLIKATDLIDAIIATLRAAKTREDAKNHLMTGKCKNIKIKDSKLSKVAAKVF